MDLEWTTLDAQSLQRIYDQAERDLQRGLLEGQDWQQIADQQRHVIELSIALRKQQEPHFETNERHSDESGIRERNR